MIEVSGDVTLRAAAGFKHVIGGVMNRVSRKLLLGVAIFIIAAMIWSKLRIGIFVSLTLWQALGLFAVVAFLLFLALDHLLNGRR